MELLYIRKVIEGDISQFSYFVETYKDMAYSVAFSIIHHKEDAQDAVQEAFVKAYRSLHKFRQDAKFSTWFYKIVVNTSLNKVKRTKTVKDVSIDKVSDTLFEQTAATYKNLEQAEQQKYIGIALDELHNEDRLILTLYYLNENSLEEITEITDIPPENLKVKLHRARKKMYVILSNLLKSEIKTIL